jgi:uncharacterized protein (DUF1015 family)
MPEDTMIVRPFRGVRYDTTESNDLSDLIAPPYDIISEDRQEELYARSEHNFVRVELPRGLGEARYAEAACRLRGWLADGVLTRELKPAFYVLEQEFVADGRTWHRRGLFCLVRLPEATGGHVLSHEGTLPEPKADRLLLTRSCRAMTSPIMVMSGDQDGRLLELLGHVRGGPTAEARDPDGTTHRLWVVPEHSEDADYAGAVGGGPLYIADGHHRYETAVTYRDEMRDQFPEARADAAFHYALCLVNSARDDGLRVFPTHRLVSGLDETARQNLRGCMERYFDVHQQPLASDAAVDLSWLDEHQVGKPVFAAYAGEGRFCRLRAKDEAVPSTSRVVDRLDVSILHARLIDPTLAGTGCDMNSDGRVSHDSEAAGPTRRGARLTYATDAAQAVRAVDRGDYDFAFFLRPTRVSEVMAAARAGERMPGKSTYFYPKIPAGLVLSDASEEPI